MSAMTEEQKYEYLCLFYKHIFNNLGKYELDADALIDKNGNAGMCGGFYVVNQDKNTTTYCSPAWRQSEGDDFPENNVVNVSFDEVDENGNTVSESPMSFLMVFDFESDLLSYAEILEKHFGRKII
jgi:hypothetical protein